MEQLKPLAEIDRPDERQLHFCIFNRDTGESRPRTISDLHFSAAELTLSASVPEQIRTHFSTAQNLLVYSWYHYPFNVTAHFMALVTVELALKNRLQSKATFKALIRKAVEDGLIRDDRFSYIPLPPAMIQETPSQGVLPESQSQSYSQSLIDSLPYLRNELAHGSTMLHSRGLTFVRLCADLIEQLYQTREAVTQDDRTANSPSNPEETEAVRPIAPAE